MSGSLMSSLLRPHLCDLLPSINKGPVKTRFCQTCGKLYRPPYTCPLDAYRMAGASTPNDKAGIKPASRSSTPNDE